MEFEEMQKIWDEQRNENVFVINQEALHRRVRAKKRLTSRIVNVTEIGLIIVSLLTLSYLSYETFIGRDYYNLIGAGVLLFSASWIFHLRRRRRKSHVRFDRSMLGELDHAISNMKATINIGRSMVYWYFIPLAVFVVIKMIIRDAELSKWLMVTGAFVFGYYLADWEIRTCHIPRKRNLEALKKKLINDLDERE